MEQQIKSLIQNYDVVSVRDSLAQKELKRLIGIECPIMIDPTLLLPIQDWHVMAGNVPIVKGKYIFYILRGMKSLCLMLLW